MTEPLLELNQVKTYFPIYKGHLFYRVQAYVKAVDGVDLSIDPGEVLGLVGESGCGKTTLGRTIMQLIKASEGSVQLSKKVLNRSSDRELFKLRPRFQMIFQDPYASLNPRMTVFDTLAEPFLIHGFANSGNVTKQVSELMEMVGLAPRFVKKYPHEFSGGQRQRIAIARAIALKPALLIADEPVSALDVSIQSQILNLFRELRRKFNFSMIFISHDLSVVRYISDKIAVMYLGKIVEAGASEVVFSNPKHPYTRALISAIPYPDPDKEALRKRILLEGDPPSPINPPSGCRFHPRCPFAIKSCSEREPQLIEFSDRKLACLRVNEIS